MTSVYLVRGSFFLLLVRLGPDDVVSGLQRSVLGGFLRRVLPRRHDLRTLPTAGRVRVTSCPFPDRGEDLSEGQPSTSNPNTEQRTPEQRTTNRTSTESTRAVLTRAETTRVRARGVPRRLRRRDSPRSCSCRCSSPPSPRLHPARPAAEPPSPMPRCELLAAALARSRPRCPALSGGIVDPHRDGHRSST